MVHKINSLALLVLFLSVFSSTLHAQKYGVVNYSSVLEEMPTYQKAKKDLKDYQEKLQKVLSEKQAVYEQEQKTLTTQFRTAKIDEATYRKGMNKIGAKFKGANEEAQRSLNTKESDLMYPVFKSLKDAIEAVAISKGYVMIFDSSDGDTVFFADQTINLEAAVKAKLGI
ncbi:OmpH family outer membrane protein [Aquimarina brevivitae]|uniref:Periplasmic chaperone for outer membrane proteins Skp n=1 Tax=Aquimarina brevivitae TaxID=323412 RepID=A0A4Q7P158_9FLAO|nr:OmpH family outer membrane protein [Aquimarina brevivitae]RZS93553.1 periplasmic chaperone for outer membrane proteins Skp [Aquimarina brevivitae]